ncbi:MAG: hypothetical protein A2045_01440 [Rhodocyclales bacterium GWA2_65_20]|nr:MAG: hypothetical protein A2045_01440 [Rhodocyclales bacterium GWA2_65_20]
MGGAGMAAAGTGIPAPSGRLFFGDFLLAKQKKVTRSFLRDATLASLSQRGKRQMNNIRAADTLDKNKVGRKAVMTCGQPFSR